MNLLLYGVAEPAGVPVSSVGPDDEPLDAVAQGALAAIAGPHEVAETEPPIELALRASWSPGAERAARLEYGASYLRERFELRQSARQVARELDALTVLALGSRRTLLPAPDLPVLDAYLVERDRVREFVAMVAELDDSLDEVELTCTAPYSFAW
jgi:hypothetical protein